MTSKNYGTQKQGLVRGSRHKRTYNMKKVIPKTKKGRGDMINLTTLLQKWVGKDTRRLTLVYTDSKRLSKRGCKFLGLFVWKPEPSVNWFSTGFSACWKVVLPPLLKTVKITADGKLTVLVILQLLLGTLRVTVKLTRTRSISLCCAMTKPWAAPAQDYSRVRLKTTPTAGRS